MPEITVNLNANALAALQAGGGSSFAFGASLITESGLGYLWGKSGGPEAATLNLTFGDPLPPPVVPLPAAAWFLLSALGGLAVLRRRGTAAAS